MVNWKDWEFGKTEKLGCLGSWEDWDWEHWEVEKTWKLGSWEAGKSGKLGKLGSWQDWEECEVGKTGKARYAGRLRI